MTTVHFGTIDRLLPLHEDLAESVELLATQTDGEFRTHERLHYLDNDVINPFKEEFVIFANASLGRSRKIERLWALIHRPPHPAVVSNLRWHRHLCTASLVYYLRVPPDLEYPDGSFSFMTPQIVNVLPQEGMAILFDHHVYHDGVPPRRSKGTRIVLACDFEWL